MHNNVCSTSLTTLFYVICIDRILICCCHLLVLNVLFSYCISHYEIRHSKLNDNSTISNKARNNKCGARRQKIASLLKKIVNVKISIYNTTNKIIINIYIALEYVENMLASPRLEQANYLHEYLRIWFSWRTCFWVTPNPFTHIQKVCLILNSIIIVTRLSNNKISQKKITCSRLTNINKNKNEYLYSAFLWNNSKCITSTEKTLFFKIFQRECFEKIFIKYLLRYITTYYCVTGRQ